MEDLFMRNRHDMYSFLDYHLHQVKYRKSTSLVISWFSSLSSLGLRALKVLQAPVFNHALQQGIRKYNTFTLCQCRSMLVDTLLGNSDSRHEATTYRSEIYAVNFVQLLYVPVYTGTSSTLVFLSLVVVEACGK